LVNKIAGSALNVGTCRVRLLRWVGGLERCGKRNKRQFVAMYGSYPEELKLREENQRRRDRPWD
jgi:hypothetical protein